MDDSIRILISNQLNHTSSIFLIIRQLPISSPMYFTHLGHKSSISMLGSHLSQKSLKKHCILKSQLILLSFTIESGSTVYLVNSYILS